MARSIEVVRDAVRTDRVSYGITTGFGAFANKRISADQVRQLQLNLVRSHACGIGEPLRGADRAPHAAAQGQQPGGRHLRRAHELVDALLAMLNNDVLPVIPSRGSVGASGDLAPLAHVSLCLIGEGEALQGDRKLEGAEVCRAAGLRTDRAGSEGRTRADQRHATEPRAGARWTVRGRDLAGRSDRHRRADGGRARRQLRAVRCTHPRSEPLTAPGRSRAAFPPATDRQRNQSRSRELRPRAGPLLCALHAASARRGRRRALARTPGARVLRSMASPTIR